MFLKIFIGYILVIYRVELTLGHRKMSILIPWFYFQEKFGHPVALAEVLLAAFEDFIQVVGCNRQVIGIFDVLF